MYNVIITSKCNLRCSYCFAGGYLTKRDHKHVFMGKNEYLSILNFLKLSKIEDISLMGGEPTLHPLFREMVEIALNEGFNLSLKSNGTWNEELSVFFKNLPKDRVRFLLNINNKFTLGNRIWKKVSRNVQKLSGKQVHLQINIFHTNFEYNSVIKLAAEAKCQLVWVIVVPSEPLSQECRQHPRKRWLDYTPRIVEMIKVSEKHNVATLGVHGVTPCMFSDKQRRVLSDCNAKLDSRCQPVFDFYPDLSVRYCFPLGDFVGPELIFHHENLQGIRQQFMSRLALIRSITFPTEECTKCSYALNNECDGGCLARRVGFKLPEGKHDILNHRAVLSRDFNLQLLHTGTNLCSRHVLFCCSTEQVIDIDPSIWKALHSLDGSKTLKDFVEILLNRLNVSDRIAQATFNSLIMDLLSKGIIVLLPHPWLHQTLPNNKNMLNPMKKRDAHANTRKH